MLFTPDCDVGYLHKFLFPFENFILYWPHTALKVSLGFWTKIIAIIRWEDTHSFNLFFTSYSIFSRITHFIYIHSIILSFHSLSQHGLKQILNQNCSGRWQYTYESYEKPSEITLKSSCWLHSASLLYRVGQIDLFAHYLKKQ